MVETLRQKLLVWGYWVRHHLFVAVPLGVAVAALAVGVVLSAPEGRNVEITESPVGANGALVDELGGLADALRLDLRTDLEGYVRKARAEKDAVVGSVAKRAGDGTCWGFNITISAAWLRDGDPAGVVVGPVGTLPAASCEPGTAGETLGEYLGEE